MAETTPRQEGNQMHTILTAKKGRRRAGRAPTSTEARRGQPGPKSRMPEAENTSGAAKRFKKTATGKFSGSSVQAAHPDEQDDQGEARHARRQPVADGDAAKLARMLPYK